MSKVSVSLDEVITLAKASKNVNPLAGIDLCCEYIEGIRPYLRRWIAISEAQPTDDQLVIIPDGFALYEDREWHSSGGEGPVMDPPTHWMPMPEAP